ncbi:MAG: alpha/beta hydrolase [Saprospiraceae bacterium]
MIPFKIRGLLWYLKFRGLDMSKMSPVEARQAVKRTLKKSRAFGELPLEPMADIQDRSIAMRDDTEIDIRIYRPVMDKVLPVIVYYHGGGFVINDIETHENICRLLAKKNQAVVVSVGYRLAPEFKFPIPSQDCYDATAWVAQNAQELGVDADRLVVAGDSAGGNLATVVAMMARDQQSFSIAAQVLIYPCTDGRLAHPSIDKNGEGLLLTKVLMEWFMEHYLDQPDSVNHPYFSPLLAEDLSNLPPAFVFTAQYDPLIDEGKLYAEKLKAARVPTTYKMYKGMIHAFLGFTKLTKTAMQAQDDIQHFLQPHLQVAQVEKIVND